MENFFYLSTNLIDYYIDKGACEENLTCKIDNLPIKSEHIPIRLS